MPLPARRGEKRSRTASFWAWGMLVACVVAAPAGNAQPLVPEAREILVAGDEVDGIGRIGSAGFGIAGITRDERVVFQAVTSTGAEGVFSAGEDGVETLWFASQPDGNPVRLGRVRANANRVVFAEGFSTTYVFNEVDGYYQITPGAAPALVERFDILPDGQEVCDLWDFVLGDSGAVGLTLYTAPPDAFCAPDALVESQYIVESGSFHKVMQTANIGPTSLVLIGLTESGSLLVNRSDGSAILSIRKDGQADAIVSAGDPSPSGEPLPSVRGVAANSLGEVAFYPKEYGSAALYRTDGGRVVRVAQVGDVIEGQYEIESFATQSDTLLGDTGAVAVGDVWLYDRTDGSRSLGVVLFPPAGTPRLLARSGDPGGINEHGAVAVYDRDRSAVLVYGANEEPKRVVGFGDPAPGGAIFAGGGLYSEGKCLAADGRVAAAVSSHVSSPALACGDADGFIALTGPSHPARDGSPFTDFRGCAFDETGVLFLGAHQTNAGFEWNLYRADGNGLERLVGPGFVTTDGAHIVSLKSPSHPEPSFVSNVRGTVVMRVVTDQGERFVRRRPEGAIESISLESDPDVAIQRVINVQIEDDDTLVAGVELATGEDAIVTSDDESVHVLAVASDPRLPDGPFNSLELLATAGERIAILGRGTGPFQRTLWYADALGFFPFFADGAERRVEQATASGRALLSEGYSQLLMTPDGNLTKVAEAVDGGRLAVDINDRENIFFYTLHSELGATHETLLLSGPTPSARCPRPPVTETPEPTATASPTETATATETPSPTATSTPTRTAAPTNRPTSTETAEPTRTMPASQTPTLAATAPIASPTADDPRDSSDGCQVAPVRRTASWLLLPLLLFSSFARCRRRSSHDVAPPSRQKEVY